MGLKDIKTFPKPPHVTHVRMMLNELASDSPPNNPLDRWEVTIDYYPIDRCLEAESLRSYLRSYQGKNCSCEELASLIAEDIYNVSKSKLVVVEAERELGDGMAVRTKAIRGEGL